MSLDIKVIKKKDYVYSVDLDGSIDNETYTQFEDELREIIDEKTKAIIVDMAKVTYVSSIGIRVIIWATKDLKKKNATFAMINLQTQIKKVFEAVKILPIIDIFDDLAEADMYIDQIIKDELEKQNV
ncbi:MAG: STAS domain-containing protein [Candidatus Omnitrophota bacterium]